MSVFGNLQGTDKWDQEQNPSMIQNRSVVLRFDR